jgi:choline-sulfatase
MAWLDRESEEPFFLFLHTYDVHSEGGVPYYASSGGRGRFSNESRSRLKGHDRKKFARRYLARERGGRLTEQDMDFIRATYADGVRWVDEQLGAIFRYLRDTGLDERTLVIVWSDHGDALFDHGDVWSHDLVNDHTIRVPLMMRIPGLPGGHRIESIVSAIDIAPTILDLVGLPIASSMEGRTILPLLQHDTTDAVAFSRRTKGESRLYSARSRRHHLIWDGAADRWSFFDVASDPAERRNLHPSGSPEEARLRARLEAWVAENVAERSLPGRVLSVESRVERELRLLGYLE